MPLTPFIGLSVLIHLLIIVWGKIWSLIKPENALATHTKPDPWLIHKIASFVIVITVFSAVAVNALILVKASLNDRYSSVALVEGYFAHSTDSSKPLTIVTVTVPKAQACDQPTDPSVVNYLKRTNKTFSFDYRAAIAQSMNITNYTGTADQNIKLLTNLTNCKY